MAYNNALTKEDLEKGEGEIDREIRSSLLMLILKDDKLQDSGKVVGGNEFHS